LTLFAGVVPGEELPIQFTGLKEGEKVSEELWEDWEEPQATENSQIFRLRGSYPVSIDIFAAVEQLEGLLAVHDQLGLLEFINEVVPSFPVQRSGITSLQIDYPQEDLARLSA